MKQNPVKMGTCNVQLASFLYIFVENGIGVVGYPHVMHVGWFLQFVLASQTTVCK